jgi:hypothetical protein
VIAGEDAGGVHEGDRARRGRARRRPYSYTGLARLAYATPRKVASVAEKERLLPRV